MCLTTPAEGFPWDDLKITSVGRTNVTDDRQTTDGRAIAYSELKTDVESVKSVDSVKIVSKSILRIESRTKILSSGSLVIRQSCAPLTINEHCSSTASDATRLVARDARKR